MSHQTKAQMTIGEVERPVDGALLQLKNIAGVTAGGVNATKGLDLLRVNLTGVNTMR